ncbi:MAG TPA: GDP-L-fucose synthase [Kofleriaceae bacterium]
MTTLAGEPDGIVVNATDAVSDFWADKRVLVTGGTGFFGSFVVDGLRARGAKQVYAPRSRDYDLIDRAAIKRLLADTKPDIVFHLAARVGGIGANRDNPAGMLFDNAMMGLQLLEEARLASIAKTVVAGSICAYPKFAPVPFREEDLWNGYPEETNAPYGIAKKLLLVQSQAYREQYGLNSIVLFPVNMYGPRDNFDLRTSHVIPAIIRKCITAKEAGQTEVTLWGDGSPTREFIYVEDAAEAMILGAERYNSSEPVNIGSGNEIAIRDLAVEIAAATGFTGRFVWDTSQPNGQPRRRLDVTRAKDRFGFTAKTSLADGLNKTVAWYLENR